MMISPPLPPSPPSGPPRETTFGGFQQAFRLFVAFDGEELTRYYTGQGAFIVDYTPSFRFKLKHTLSLVRSEESELFTVEGGYRLSDISTDYSSEQFNEEIGVRGIGSEVRNARNYLEVQVYRFTQNGEVILDKDYFRKAKKNTYFTRHKLLWGATFQYDKIDDYLKEWNALDSADYLHINEYIEAENHLDPWHIYGYIQENFQISPGIQLISGIRAHYYSLNQQLLISPRLQLVYNPRLRKKIVRNAKDSIIYASSENALQFRFAVGAYNQPPFYRELRDFSGQVHPATRAQNSIHLIAGLDYIFYLWKRPFKLFTEVYYKHLYSIVPYQIDNVRIRYFPATESDKPITGIGYAYGIDFKINGQFIPDVDSWFSISLMRTQENVTDDTKKFIRRPTDQLVMFNFYFQDEVPGLKSLKAHINFIYGSGLPFGPPGKLDNRTALDAPMYLRVDLGISQEFIFKHPKNRKFQVQSLWIGLEVFNLFGRSNTVSYQWVRDITTTTYAVPNYLSARLLNLKAILRF